MRHLETLDDAEYWAQVQYYKKTTSFACHFIQWARRSYDAFVFSIFSRISNFIKGQRFYAELPVYLLLLQEEKEDKDQRIDQLITDFYETHKIMNMDQSNYFANLISTVDWITRERKQAPTAFWTLRPNANECEMITRVCGYNHVSLGLGNIVGRDET